MYVFEAYFGNLYFKRKIDQIIFFILPDGKLFLKDSNNMISPFTSSNFNFDPLNTTLLNNYSIPLCLGRSFSLCPILPNGLLNIAGMFEIKCGDKITIGRLPYEYDIVYYQRGLGGSNLDFLIPTNPTQNPFNTLFSQLKMLNITNNEITQENKLSFIVNFTQKFFFF